MTIVIYGAGQAGAMCRNWLPAGADLLCFADSDPGKQGILFCGIPVVSPEEAVRMNPDRILIAVLNREAVTEIRERLEATGYKGLVQDIGIFRSLQDLRLSALRMAKKLLEERRVEGAVAELGVYQGDFAREINRLFPDRTLILFDTFEGFDERDTRRETEVTGAGRFRDFSDTGVEKVRSVLPNPEKAVFVKGHFPESVVSLNEEPDTYALVSLDPDLYAPAKTGLEYFWPRLSEGGVILIHDYTSAQFPGVKKAVDEYCAHHGLYVVPLSDLHGTAVLIRQGEKHI